MSDTPPRSSRLKHRVVVITGASSGFGRGAALKFARHGSDVVMASRRGDLIDELSEQLDEFGVRSLAVETDVSDARAVEHLA